MIPIECACLGVAFRSCILRTRAVSAIMLDKQWVPLSVYMIVGR